MNRIGLITGERTTRFTIVERDGCILVEGALPPHWLTAIAKVAPKKAIVSPELASMLDCNFAFGLAKDVEELIAKIKPDAEAAAVQNRAPGLSEAAARWLASGERGISSNSIFTHLTGINALESWSSHHPHDPDDFRRCRLLLEQVPELKEQFQRMATASKAWAGLVRNWDSICEQMNREIPDWRKPPRGSSAPNTYKLIKLSLGE